ncbi:MAG: universal stress protein [Gammaproteobacteria bacterium]|jgi:nucleotide-binding universal stress UspA family protein|nr:universal stress protein [Gammaproteobacteria bacterium]MDP6617226.1 universal stress protein [Gammaproteobacteria bacterium]MDP6695813.1 universal stress protein [Gammaproteobacteria bacterium]
MKSILVPVSNRPESKTALLAAADLAMRVDANITACHLRPHRDIDRDYSPVGVPLFGTPKNQWIEQLHKKSTATAARETKKFFHELVPEAGLKIVKRTPLGTSGTAIWQEKVGSPDRLMAILGPVNDLTVLSRPSAKAGVARMFALAALLRSSRPVLFLPPRQSKAPGKRVAIAWHQGAETGQLVTAAMPILQTAEQVTIIHCGPEIRLGPKSSHLKIYLRNWGINAKVIATRGRNEEAELLAAYRDSKSDLLLMGAYSRARLREVVFGGMTEYMLWKAKIPLIIQHA